MSSLSFHQTFASRSKQTLHLATSGLCNVANLSNTLIHSGWVTAVGIILN